MEIRFFKRGYTYSLFQERCRAADLDPHVSRRSDPLSTHVMGAALLQSRQAQQPHHFSQCQHLLLT